MGVCTGCGNDYDKSFEIQLGGKRYTFDCFECAIHVLAPACAHCGVRIIGHGTEADNNFFCSAHCAAEFGLAGLRDRM
ncbi:MAG: hypothetical protein ACT4PM_01330 [Gemmatimonadales bacterium]